MANALAWISAGSSGLIVSEDFESGTIPNGWTRSTSGTGTADFSSALSPAPLRGTASLRCDSNGGNASAQVDWTTFASPVAAQNEVWAAFLFNWNPAAGDNAFVFRIQGAGGTNLAMARLFDSGAPRIYCGGSTNNNLVGTTASATTYFAWLHYSNTGVADFEFETTSTRLGPQGGANGNYGTVSDATITSQATIFFLGLAAVGSPENTIIDEVRVSNTGYPALS